MKLTKRKAIEYCAEMWEKVAEDNAGSVTDGEYPTKWNAYGKMRVKHKNLPSEITHCCFFCEYTDKDCPSCPGLSIWGATKRTNTQCEALRSPYRKWANAKTPRTRKKYAKQIADGCRKLLKEMDKKKKARKK